MNERNRRKKRRLRVTLLPATLAGLLALPGPLVAESAAASSQATPASDQAAPASAQAVPVAIVGTWLGTLTVQAGIELRIVFHIEASEEGALSVTLDSPDQGATGIPVDSVDFDGATLRLVMAAIRGGYEGSLQPDGEQLEGEWRQGGMVLPLKLEKVETVEAPKRPQEPKPPFSYASQEVRFPNREAEIELAGTLTVPEGDGPFPAAVLISGSGPQDRDEALLGHKPFLVLSDYLTRQRIAVLRFDDRGVGESGGRFADATTEDFASDALAAAEYLRGRSEVDPARVGLIGHSEGGLVAPLTATRSADVAFIVLMAGPGLSGEEILYLQGTAILRVNGASEEMIARQREAQEGMFAIARAEADEGLRKTQLREYLEQELATLTPEERATAQIPEDTAGWITDQLTQVGSEWFRFFLMHDPRPVLRQVQVPVLAINGELDLQVPSAENLPAVKEALLEGGNPDVTVREFKGLNHLFQHAETGSPGEYARIEETFAPEAMALIADWILERFGSR